MKRKQIKIKIKIILQETNKFKSFINVMHASGNLKA